MSYDEELMCKKSAHADSMLMEILSTPIEEIGVSGYPSVDGVKTRSFPIDMGGWLILRRGSDMFLFPRYISCHMNITHRRLSERLNASQEIYDRLDDIKRILSL